MPALRVLVAEDSPTARALLVEVLESEAGIEVVGEARTGAEAVKLAAHLRPDVITMDVEMPVMNGIDATREIMMKTPTPIVVVSAIASRRETALSLDATEAGALWLARKPSSPLAPGFDEECRALIATVKSMAQVKVVRRWSRVTGRTTPVTPIRGEEIVADRPIRVVAMAASTGGPAALHQIFARLPRGFPVPILVVQHIADGFTAAFAAWLDAGCALQVKIACDGDPALAGSVYIAPEHRHLGVGSDGRIALASTAPVGGFRPSATHLFESVAKQYGEAAVGVILTGMGADGVAGLRRIHAAGGRVLAQDEGSSVVFGMPREAVHAGIVSAVLSPAGIAERLRLYVAGGVNGQQNSRR